MKRRKKIWKNTSQYMYLITFIKNLKKKIIVLTLN